MKTEYDKYYKRRNLFGEPFPELIEFYSTIDEKGRLLDIGCGQGRDSIALAKLGYQVTGIDNSKTGIDQLNEIAEKDDLKLQGIIADMYTYTDYENYKFVLLNSMFHFNKREKEKETEFLRSLIELLKTGTKLTICIQRTGKKLEVLESILKENSMLKIIQQCELLYIYEDKEIDHKSESKYEMITTEKR